eukprot:TRINITY_DN3296_c0_g1_i2.p1 TRINITY_DN3296_c0_g1~~TRINITY_DN3296_c0_g1_i2.p1  ORF type:complete len:310 (+),score=67.68 TRINITY_DN3296_c0_g1_i2:37-930(+)
MMLALSLLAALAAPATAQPGGPACAQDGSDNVSNATLSYNASTGRFTGTITSNGCANHVYCEGCDPFRGHSQTTISQSFPASGYGNGARAAPLRGRVGLTISGGINIYGPMEAGFQEGFACTGGVCEAGIDVPLCIKKLEYECRGPLDYSLFDDTCGGHATPYHYHGETKCVYDRDNSTVHSEAVGVALDGYGIYGLWEGDNLYPADLDACNGHYGRTPDSGANSVYHYHFTTDEPYSLGCFGPVTSLQQCKNLYSSCTNPNIITITTEEGEIEYALDCPCFDTRLGKNMDHVRLHN